MSPRSHDISGGSMVDFRRLWLQRKSAMRFTQDEAEWSIGSAGKANAITSPDTPPPNIFHELSSFPMLSRSIT